MKRTTFLPIFFTALAVVFGIAVWVRLSAYEATPLRDDNVGQASVRPSEETHDPVETGTIVETSPTTTPRSSREQRFNELIKAPPPSAPTPPPAPKESFIDRMMNPIANALGMNRSKPAPPPANTAEARPASAQEARPEQPPRQDDPNSGGQGRQTEKPEEDPETDMQPPRLLSADFSPPQVQDDGETLFAAQVIDNLSGVRSVSGVISSPSGALQGFSCQREGDTDRFVSRVKVPKDAAEGVWSVKYLTLSDQANNTTSLNQSAGTLPASASFRVTSSSSDSSAPELQSVYLEKRAMNAGERNTVFIQTEDGKSGVALVSGVFVSPARNARLGFGCRAGANGAWECTLSPPSCLDCGTWRLEQIQVQDKANNMATFRGDNQLVSQITLDISSQMCDSRPPVITALSVQPNAVSNAEGGVININAIAHDDLCGVASLSGQAIPASAPGQRISFTFDASQDGQNFNGRINVPRHSAKGMWTIAWIQALDKGYNLKAYGTNEPVLQRVTFRVE